MMSPLLILFLPNITLFKILRFISGFIFILLIIGTYTISLIGLAYSFKTILLELEDMKTYGALILARKCPSSKLDLVLTSMFTYK